eukprot:m.114282 g.114282  ORF g.114282 m.114282 type:complete len:86 (-) comp16289_c0_seq1:1169-1426(-)
MGTRVVFVRNTTTTRETTPLFLTPHHLSVFVRSIPLAFVLHTFTQKTKNKTTNSHAQSWISLMFASNDNKPQGQWPWGNAPSRLP